MTETQRRQELVAICHRLYARQYIAGLDGNVSCRLDRDRLLITPSGVCKGEIGPQDLIEISLSGQHLVGTGRPSSETPMHLTAYEVRPDVQAVIHTHAPYSTAFSIAGISLSDPIIPETIVTLGEVPITAYATPSSDESAQAIRRLIDRHDALVLKHHGTLTVGRSLAEAFYRLESLEHAARIVYMARQLGGAPTLPPQEVAKLQAQRAALGLTPSVSTPDFSPQLVQQIAAEVIRALKD